ncbi:hypothetical protein P7C71_g468, partial [Lecanoromycetidae sp. Uapishka_2]
MAPRVLLIGGHGKISQLLTPLVLSRSWQVTSLIRDPAQNPTITALGKNQPGKIDVLVSSIEDIKSQSQAQSIIDSAKPTYIVFSAGAGGKGGPERTLAIDRDACTAFIKAATATPSVSKFLLISYVGSRREKAPWWSEADWIATQETNNGVLKNYYPAKIAADECLTALSAKRGSGFAGISLRPGNLTEQEGEGKVALGKTAAKGKVRRGDVARIAMALLEDESVSSCWLDLLEGAETVESAIRRCVKEHVDCSEGESLEDMKKEWL